VARVRFRSSGELLDFRDDAITAGAVARCIVSRRANRDIDEMLRRRRAIGYARNEIAMPPFLKNGDSRSTI
jgi:hypothetical protein